MFRYSQKSYPAAIIDGVFKKLFNNQENVNVTKPSQMRKWDIV